MNVCERHPGGAGECVAGRESACLRAALGWAPFVDEDGRHGRSRGAVVRDDRCGGATAVAQARGVATGAVTARELVAGALARVAALDARLRAFTEVFEEDAVSRADELDRRLAREGHPVGPLHGVPVAVKDDTDVAGRRTGFGTGAVRTPASQDSELVRRLRAAGAVVVGHTTMPEFGQSAFTSSVTHGTTRNPWDPARCAGGSSGGSAAAVASGMVALATGTDAAGSIRVPAAWCGLVGVKPQRGRVSTAPWPSIYGRLGVPGPLARTVADAALLLDAMTGTTAADRYRAAPWRTSATRALAEEPGPLRIRVVMDAPVTARSELDENVRRAVRSVAEHLARSGHELSEGALPRVRLGPAFDAPMAAGVLQEAQRVDEVRRLETRTRHSLWVHRLSARGVARAEARAVGIATRVNAVFEEVDVVLSPTVPCPAPAVDEVSERGFFASVRRTMHMVPYTAVWNVLGNPAVAVPVGVTGGGLPLSVQLIGPDGSEPRLLQVAAQVEAAFSLAGSYPELG